MIGVSWYFLYCASTPAVFHFIDYSNLIFHEAGHSLFIFFGDFVHIAMGSGFQVLLPFALGSYFFIHKQNLSAAFCLMWCGESLTNVSVYAGDAIAMQLPLLGGDSVIHDWNYLLTSTTLLSHTSLIASSIYTLGISMIFIAIGSATVSLCADLFSSPVKE